MKKLLQKNRLTPILTEEKIFHFLNLFEKDENVMHDFYRKEFFVIDTFFKSNKKQKDIILPFYFWQVIT